MKVLVTGANGFVGRALLPAFIPFGHQARVAVRGKPSLPFEPNVEVREIGDLAQGPDWTPLVEGCDAVVHLAGIAHIGPGVADETYDKVNHQATVALARAAKAGGVKRFIFMSSIRAQSGPSADHVLTEDDTPLPTEAYGRSKLAAENAIREMDLPYTILRPVLIYGPGAKGNFAKLVRYSMLRAPLPLGSLKKERSLVSVTSTVQAIIFALTSPKALKQTFILADPTPISVAAVVTALRRGLGRGPGIFPVPLPVLRFILMIGGLGGALERIDGKLIASSNRLVAAGWQAPPETASSLTFLGKRYLAKL